jgi:hypothetical protein
MTWASPPPLELDFILISASSPSASAHDGGRIIIIAERQRS